MKILVLLLLINDFLNSNVKARKNFMNLIQKFIRQFPNKDFARIMLDILSLNEQIASDELNKNIIEDKLAFMLNDYDNSIKKNFKLIK